jgi:hydrogenase nickel incorporation protein HypA/HybF
VKKAPCNHHPAPREIYSPPRSPLPFPKGKSMHEMALVTNIVDAVVKHADENNVKKVVSITLVIGELHDVVDSLMESCFRYLARGTVAEGARVEVKKEPVRLQCKECMLVYPADLKDAATVLCPDCGAKNYSIYAGNEFLIKSIEVA